MLFKRQDSPELNTLKFSNYKVLHELYESHHFTASYTKHTLVYGIGKEWRPKEDEGSLYVILAFNLFECLSVDITQVINDIFFLFHYKHFTCNQSGIYDGTLPPSPVLERMRVRL